MIIYAIEGSAGTGRPEETLQGLPHEVFPSGGVSAVQGRKLIVKTMAVEEPVIPEFTATSPGSTAGTPSSRYPCSPDAESSNSGKKEEEEVETEVFS
jgi:hypothetical protein